MRERLRRSRSGLWQARKIHGSWVLWLTVDVVYFWLYGSQHLGLTALTQVALGTCA